MLAKHYAVISENAAGDHEQVAAHPGRRITVIAYQLVLAGDVGATFKSATTAITGPLDPAAAAVVGFAGSEQAPAFTTERGEALNLNLNAPVQVSGHLTYVLER